MVDPHHQPSWRSTSHPLWSCTHDNHPPQAHTSPHHRRLSIPPQIIWHSRRRVSVDTSIASSCSTQAFFIERTGRLDRVVSPSDQGHRPRGNLRELMMSSLLHRARAMSGSWASRSLTMVIAFPKRPGEPSFIPHQPPSSLTGAVVAQTILRLNLEMRTHTSHTSSCTLFTAQHITTPQITLVDRFSRIQLSSLVPKLKHSEITSAPITQKPSKASIGEALVEIKTDKAAHE